MTAEDLVEARLKSTATVTALIGARVFPISLPFQAPMPAVTYQRISTARIQGFRGSLGLVDPRIQVDCWADNYDVSKAVADAVRGALDGYTATGVFAMILAERDLPEPDLSRHRVSQDYSVWFDE